MFARILFSITLTLSIISCNKQVQKSSDIPDGIDSLLKLAEDRVDKTVDVSEHLNQAYTLNKKINNDSVYCRKLLDIAYSAYMTNHLKIFLTTNSEALSFAKSIKDTFAMGDSHWNFGNYYGDNDNLDSAYFHYHEAEKYFDAIDHSSFSGKMHYNMAVILGRIKDYPESEKETYQAITAYGKTGNDLSLYRCYNHLGLIFIDLEEYDNAAESFDQAMTHLQKRDDQNERMPGLLNNIGLLYARQGMYDKGLEYFQKGLDFKDLKSNNLELYARLLDNHAYYSFLNDNDPGSEVHLLKSLQLRDSTGNQAGVTISKIRLAEFYNANDNTDKALKYAQDAYETAVLTGYNRDKLNALNLLADLNPSKARDYSREYISLSDSLYKLERNERNKFARIRFETDEFKEQNVKLYREKNWIIILSFLLVAILMLIHFLRLQKSKNKELQLVNEQKLANEKIYELLLKQQSEHEEGKIEERNRISRELHDGILGKLFGLRMRLGFAAYENKTDLQEKSKEYITEIQEVETEIRNISHELNMNTFLGNRNFTLVLQHLFETYRLNGAFKIEADLKEDIEWNRVSEKIKVNLYRILQESLQNISKHAEAKVVVISLSQNGDQLEASIEDNGRGFVISKKSKGIGIKNLRDRVANCNGHIEIASKVNEGTKIEITLPLNDEDEN
ncbi:tetratricopeptide repeat-containing sensor histidine kinase [Robertkochia solimangrovi]|uniref:tetratricopeptide repeat-containing sensor histidine kinase n=1 Tax=Robertkochia solimangrovi TaxID=2213046 RepID=UPI001180D7CB|nr:ATP-binding protein [Robertkochia solimangrovi]TRZ42254.1 hypothetical protein DMZ48_14595 [Robertkochia solimangrovi]